jgi:hypothetical protein
VGFLTTNPDGKKLKIGVLASRTGLNASAIPYYNNVAF